MRMTSGFTCSTLLWLALFLPIGKAGIQPFDLLLEPTEEFIHYNDGYIRAPGFIDLKGLVFTALSDSFVSNDDDTDNLGSDDKFSGGDSSSPPRRNSNRKLDGGIEDGGTDVDIAIFRLPRKCVHSKAGCNWPELGVGKISDDGSLRWCCSQEAIDLGLCNDQDNGFGRLIIDKNLFQGVRRFVSVPREGPMNKTVRYGHVEENQSGTYVVLYANCNERGREVYVKGESVWKSKHGYLPGELYGFMYFFTFLMIIYFGLLLWYGILMYANEESRIDIERWIFMSICLGLLEMIFRSADYYIWNIGGYRSNVVIWAGVLIGVFKQGVSRCLTVMVSLGWGVVRDSLGSTMRVIVVLGTIYIVASSVENLMVVFAIEDMNTLRLSTEEKILTVVRMLNLLVSIIDVIFIMWILDALNNTMLYLENMNQSRKLERFLKLRCLFLFAILFAVMWTVFTIVHTVDEEGIVGEEWAWAIDAATEINYLFVLIGVAYLWRPNPSARDYAYVMELPGMGTDEDNELELAGVVPSAMDDDDDGSAGKNGFGENGFHDDEPDGGNDHRFQIT